MLNALLWGLVGGSTLVVGAVAGCFVRLPRRILGAVMAGGAGVLIASVAYELVDEAARAGTRTHTSWGWRSAVSSSSPATSRCPGQAAPGGS